MPIASKTITSFCILPLFDVTMVTGLPTERSNGSDWNFVASRSTSTEFVAGVSGHALSYNFVDGQLAVVRPGSFQAEHGMTQWEKNVQGAVISSGLVGSFFSLFQRYYPLGNYTLCMR